MNPLSLSGLAILFTVLFVIFRGLELTMPKSRRTPLIRPGVVTDLSYWVFNPLIAEAVIRFAMLIALAAFALIVYGRVEKSEILHGFGPVNRLPIAVQAVLMLVLADFIGYWVHRTFHGRRLWRFHAIHHSSKTLDWLSAARVHPVNELAGKLAAMIPLLGVGFSGTAVAWAGPVLGVFGLLLHANVDWDWGPLRAVIASPRFHRWHHTSDADGLNKNFAGLFPIWDVLFGTYYMPRGRIPDRFGTDTPVPDGLYAQLLFPFRSRA